MDGRVRGYLKGQWLPGEAQRDQLSYNWGPVNKFLLWIHLFPPLSSSSSQFCRSSLWVFLPISTLPVFRLHPGPGSLSHQCLSPCVWVFNLSSTKNSFGDLLKPAHPSQNNEFFYLKNIFMGVSLVAQWLRIRLPMQRTGVQALVQEDPTWRRATKPVHHNYWACALEPVSHNYWSPCSTTREATTLRSPCTAKSSPCSPQLEKARQQQQRPNAAKNK